MVVASAGYLLPGPFAGWIAREAAEVGGFAALAELLGVDESRVRRLADCRPSGAGASGLVTVDLVDKWMTARFQHGAELYGPLWALSIPEGDGCGKECRACAAPLRTPAELCGFCIEERQL